MNNPNIYELTSKDFFTHQAQKIDEEIMTQVYPPCPQTQKELDALPEYIMFGEREPTPEELKKIVPTVGKVKISFVKDDLIIAPIGNNDPHWFVGSNGKSYRLVMTKDLKWWKEEFRL